MKKRYFFFDVEAQDVCRMETKPKVFNVKERFFEKKRWTEAKIWVLIINFITVTVK